MSGKFSTETFPTDPKPADSVERHRTVDVTKKTVRGGDGGENIETALRGAVGRKNEVCGLGASVGGQVRFSGDNMPVTEGTVWRRKLRTRSIEEQSVLTQ